MKIYAFNQGLLRLWLPPKLLLIMRLIIVLLTACFLQVSASTFGQRITLSEKNATLEKVLHKIALQADIKVVYADDFLQQAKAVTVKINDRLLADALDEVFKNQILSYVLKDNTIIVKQKEVSLLDKVVAILKNIDIKGTVTDSGGLPLPGASVKVKGTDRGTVTNSKGEFYLQNVDERSVLEVSYVGFKTQSVTVDNKTELNITLAPAEGEGLDEVVVVAFGTQKKETVTGAIASIQTKEIKQSPAANLAVTLAGRLPGLTAIQRGGEPGRDITELFIRGQGTINAQSPIVLVDGVERDLTYIDPNEVQSITILKDASSTAIFGVRGANGVILVTTRRGTSEIPEINFSAEGGAQGFTRFISPVNSSQYATLKNLAQMNDGLAHAFSAQAVEKYRTGVDPLRYPNTNWKDILIKDLAPQSRYNLNVSGAAKSTKYFINAGYLNQGGQFNTEKDLPYDPGFKLDRYNFRSNIDVQLNKSLKAFLNVAGYLEKQNSPFGVFNALSGNINSNFANQSTAQYIIASINDLPATIPGPLTPEGGVITSSTNVNPAYGLLNRTGYIQQTRSNVIATYGMEQSLDFITKGLSAKAVMSFDSKTINNLFASKAYEKYVQVIDPNVKGDDGEDNVYYRAFNNDKNTPLTLSGGKAFTSFSNVQGYLNYSRSFGPHAVSGLVLYQQQKTIIDAELPYNLRGLAARVTYGYQNRYFAEFNAGYNGSEQFAKKKRFGFFPAVSAAWVVSNEKFLEGNSIITNLKLRGSYGLVGNDRIGGRRFLYLDNIQVNGGGYSPSLGLGNVITTNLLRNENLQWEISRKSNIGLEVGIVKDFNLVVDVFKEKRDNILRSRGTIPVLNGLTAAALPPVNIGIVQNMGYELEVNYKKTLARDFSILTKLNLNYATNKQLFADEFMLTSDYAYTYRETGYRIGQPFGYIVDGYFNSVEEINNSPLQNVGGHESRPGDFKYKNLNGDNVIDERDRAPLGYSTVPEYQFGGAFNVTYKNFDISALIQGVANVSVFYQGLGTFADANFVSRHLDSWTEERFKNGEFINYPRLTTQRSPNEILNSYFLENAGYVRLKNIEIGYTMPFNLSRKIGAKRVRLYANGLNLYTWDHLPSKNFDPELTSNLAYPIVKIYNLGVNIVF